MYLLFSSVDIDITVTNNIIHIVFIVQIMMLNTSIFFKKLYNCPSFTVSLCMFKDVDWFLLEYLAGEAAKKMFFGGLTTQTLTPLSSLVVILFLEPFLELQKSYFSFVVRPFPHHLS